MKPKFAYNQYGVKSSYDKYRNINGVHYQCWTSDPGMFDAEIREAQEEGLKTLIINGELYKEDRIMDKEDLERETASWKKHRQEQERKSKEFQKLKIKETLIYLTKKHKKACNGECGISLFYVVKACDKMGIKLSQKERLSLL